MEDAEPPLPYKLRDISRSLIGTSALSAADTAPVVNGLGVGVVVQDLNTGFHQGFADDGVAPFPRAKSQLQGLS